MNKPVKDIKVLPAVPRLRSTPRVTCQREQWKLAEITAGLAEAKKGEFAREADVARVFNKYKTAPSRCHQDQAPTGRAL